MKCAKCGCPEHNDDANYCWNCGHELNSNYCTNDHCVLNNCDNDEDRIPCDETASFCPECGSETDYKLQGLVSPIDFKDENQ